MFVLTVGGGKIGRAKDAVARGRKCRKLSAKPLCSEFGLIQGLILDPVRGRYLKYRRNAQHEARS